LGNFTKCVVYHCWAMWLLNGFSDLRKSARVQQLVFGRRNLFMVIVCSNDKCDLISRNTEPPAFITCLFLSQEMKSVWYSAWHQVLDA
jgi:hypothetical protein